MKEEIARIMKLVQEGKLSPEDAAELVEAFAERPHEGAPAEEPSAESPFSKLIGSIENLTREVGKQVDWQDVSKHIKESVAKGVEAMKQAGEEASKGRGWTIFGQQATAKVDLPLHLAAGQTLRVECASADLKVEGGATEGRIEIEASFRAFNEADAKAAAAAFTPVLEEGDGFVGFRYTESDMAHAEVVAKVPVGVLVEVKLASGNASVSGTQASARVETHSGDVLVTGAAGNVDLKTTSGDVTLEATPAAVVTVESKSGDVKLKSVTGVRNVRSTSGAIHLDEIEATSLSVESASGDIQILSSQPVTGTFNLRTVSGDVTLDLPDGSDARVSLSSVSGGVDVDGLELTDRAEDGKRITGRMGAGQGSVDASSVSGDVRVALRGAPVS